MNGMVFREPTEPTEAKAEENDSGVGNVLCFGLPI